MCKQNALSRCHLKISLPLVLLTFLNCHISPPLQANDASLPSSDSKTNHPTLLNIEGTPELIVIFGRHYRGIHLNRVGKEGVLQGAGLEPGDVLLSLNTFNVHSKDESEKILRSIPSGTLSLVFARMVNGKYKLIENKVNYTNPNLIASGVLKTRLIATSEDPKILEERMVDLINEDRVSSSYNLPPLKKDLVLTRLARSHAEDMSKRRYFSHVTPEGYTAERRARALGVKGPIAENLLSGAITVEEAQEEFMDEPSTDPHNHRANILNPAYRLVGVGIVRNHDQTLLIVQEFAQFSPGTNETSSPKQKHNQ